LEGHFKAIHSKKQLNSSTREIVILSHVEDAQSKAMLSFTH